MERPSKEVMTRLLACLLAAWSVTIGLAEAQSAAPAPIPHSGVITGTSGRRAVDSIPVIFALYVGPTNGGALWIEVQTVQTDASGRYEVRLGSTTALPPGLDTRPSLWLGVQPAGQPEQPRTRFTPPLSVAAEPTVLDPEARPDEALRVFLDCTRCDDDYLRQEITYLNYVVDREDAQVHVLVTTQPTGGGTEFTFAFIGLEAFTGRDDQVVYVSSSTDTRDEQRSGVAQTLQLGLLPYLAGTALASQIDIVNDPGRQLGATQPEDDPWNFWRFRASGNGNFDTEESQEFLSASGAFSADRTTEAWKIRLNARGNFSSDKFDFGNDETFTNTTTDWRTTMLFIRSLGDHWGVGVGGSVLTSTFRNQDRALRVAPAIEYNVFPYAESTRRQLTFTYAIGANAFDYEEVTIFGKTSEFLTDETFTVSLDLVQPWGRSGLSVEIAHFFQDIEKYRAVVSGNLDFRVFRGLSLEVVGYTSLIRDQVFLPARGSSPEEILVFRRQLATDYRRGLFLGLSYTFGSIFNNVVNSRFAGSSGGVIRRF